MEHSRLPTGVREFILAHLHSVEQLEVLLFMREGKGSCWDAAAISSHLRTNTTSVADRLEDLRKRGFLVKDAASKEIVYRYQPDSEELAMKVDDLAACYGIYRVAILNLMFSQPSQVLRNFVDAFKFRKDT